MPRKISGSVTRRDRPLSKNGSARLRKFQDDLKELVNGSLQLELRVKADVSDRIFGEIIDHWDRDVQRLENEQLRGIDPSKYFGYLGFWIRKLKPVSKAVSLDPYEDDPNDHSAVEDINEQLAICIAIRGIMRSVYASAILDNASTEGNRRRNSVRRFLKNYLMSPTGEREESNYQSLVYDMRYRTFGPHHITHILKWAQATAIRRSVHKARRAKR